MVVGISSVTVCGDVQYYVWWYIQHGDDIYFLYINLEWDCLGRDEI